MGPWAEFFRRREKKREREPSEGKAPGKGAPVQAFFILAREMKPFLSRKYM
jgi:hypothetical protein